MATPKILRIINRLNLGGPTYNAAYLSKYLAPEFETMLVAGMIESGEESSEFITEKMGLHPVYIPKMNRRLHPQNDWHAYNHLKSIIKNYKPDIVHTHAAKAGALGRLAAAECNVRTIVHTFHGHTFHSYFPRWQSKLFINIERFLANKSSCIIAVSEKQKRELADVYHLCSADKIEVVPLGLELKKFTEDVAAKREKFRHHYQISDDEIVIVIVGRLVPVKNHSLFLIALKKVLKATKKKIRAFIIGDGEERRGLEQQARDLEISFTDYTRNPIHTTLTFTSWIRDIDEAYAASDIVALTSLNEGTPVSLIEAQVASKPIVTTNAGSVAEILDEGKTAFIVPCNDSAAFSQRLLELVEDDSLRNRMSGGASSITMERFDYRHLISNTTNLYHRLLHR